jgi:hypothetical protein
LITKKLGEMLISEGKISQFELEETLKGQAIFGGRFGTNLVEMGYLDEQELAHFLSQKTGVPCALPEAFLSIPPQVIRLVPQEIAKKFRVVPLALNNRKLSLAMADPSDFAAVDEISFVTGYIVVPLVAADMRIVGALEKYYDVKREMRYITVAGGGRNRGRSPQAPAAALPSQAAPSKPPVAIVEDEIFELPPLDDLECFGDMAQAEAPAPLQDFAGAQLPQAEEDFSMEGVLLGLSQAEDRHRIAELIVGYAAQQFNRAALFLLKGAKATGWLAQVGKKPLPGFENLEISLAEPSVLRVISQSKSHYLGALPISPCNGRILAALGGGTPMTQLLVPLVMAGRVIAVLYVEGGTPQLDERANELQKLLGKGSLAFEILILRNKILLT